MPSKQPGTQYSSASSQCWRNDVSAAQTPQRHLRQSSALLLVCPPAQTLQVLLPLNSQQQKGTPGPASCSCVHPGFVTIYRGQNLSMQVRLFHVPSASEQEVPHLKPCRQTLCLQLFHVHLLISFQLVFTYLVTFFLLFVY